MVKIVRAARTRLIEERKSRRWSQQTLADRLGTTRNNVSRWELGLTTPSAYFRTKLCDLFGTDAENLDLLSAEAGENSVLAPAREEGALRRAQPTGAAPGGAAPETPYFWCVPHRRNPWFTGQETILTRLAHALQQTAQPLALCGMGGIGKTQLAVEYAYRHVLEYRAVFWIEAETVESIVSSLLRAASVLVLPQREDRDQQRVLAAVQNWLSTHLQWLLIWDNAEDLELLGRFLPATPQGAILITTRSQALGTLARGIDLLPMGREEGVRFLLRRTKVLEPETADEHMRQLAALRPAEYAVAEELVATMGGLPLALDQAGAYIDEVECGLAGYLRRYEQRRYQLLNRRGTPGRDHPQSVVATLWLSCQRVAERSPAALELLRFCAFVSPDAIPEELLLAGGSHLGSVLGPAAADPTQFDQALATLRSLSLVQRHPETETFSLHRLVQVTLREGMGEQERAMWQQRVILTLDALFPEVSSENTADVWRRCERLLPHALAVVNTFAITGEDQALVKLLEKAATYLRERVQYEQAEPLYQRALRLGEQVLGTEHPDIAHLYNGLATLYQEQGKFDLAEPLYRRALHIWGQAPGAERSLVAYPLGGLATLYEKQGKSNLAEPLYQQALRIRERTLGPEHPLVAPLLNGLAILYRRQGKDELAEPLFLRALRIRERALGPEHPQLARLLYNLAHIYQEQGKYAQAEPLLLRSLNIEEQTWGPEHPDMSYPLIGLAGLYQKQGRYKEAESLFQRGLALCERAWGPEHVLVAYPLHNLAMLYQVQGRYAQAEQLSRRALSIAEQALGPEHPQVAHPLNGLADLYVERKKYDLAYPLYQRALAIRERALGAEHPDLAATLIGLANLFREQGCYDEAQPLYQRALSIREQRLGPRHPETAQTLRDLALFHQKRGNSGEALALAERALQIYSQSLGETHPQTTASRTLRAQLVREQGRLPDAPMLEQPPGVLQATAEDDLLQGFLAACCELHPHAWCRSADLWNAYTQWAVEHQEPYPLSRGMFIAQMKRHGCRASRTMSARIWRGVVLVKNEA